MADLIDDARIFQGIIVRYPSISTYSEHEGKPYFSIKYIENGQGYIGYGTYKPEVLSEYLKKYFIPSAQPTQNNDSNTLEALECVSKSKVIEHIAQQYTAHGEIVPEWLHIGDLPTAQPEPPTHGSISAKTVQKQCNRTIDDCISRQAAIDVVRKSIFDFFDICDDDEESPMTHKDKLLLEVNKAITTRIKALPSAQAETCEYWDRESNFCALYRPSAQPNVHDVPDDADYISRETMKDAIDSTTWYHQNRNKDMVEGAPDVEAAWYKAEDVYKAIENVPSAQPEITDEKVMEYCDKRRLVVHSLGYFQWLKSKLPEKCEDCANFNKARLLIPQPERKKGKWIDVNGDGSLYECDQCHDLSCCVGKYCMECGARMEVEK